MAVFLNIDNSILNQKQEFQIEGELYKIKMNWNRRTGWAMNIYSEKDVTILAGLTMRPEQNLTWRYTRSGGLFSGELFCLNTHLGSKEEQITTTNFGQGKKYQLTYLTREEVLSAKLDPRST